MSSRRYLDALLDQLGVPELVVLVGHDWGGVLAFDWPAAIRARYPLSGAGRTLLTRTNSSRRAPVPANGWSSIDMSQLAPSNPHHKRCGCTWIQPSMRVVHIVKTFVHHRFSIGVAAVLVALAGCSPAAPDWGGVVSAAGEDQREECRGVEGPAVVLVHGIGDSASSASFHDVLAELPARRRVCRFDRPGAGDSPPPRRAGRDGDDLDRELAAVVDRADPTEPVVLVGHSFGSYPVLRYAAAHRDRVHSVVLLDGVDPALGLLAALDARSWSDVRMAREGLDLAAVQQQTETALSGEHPLGNVPLVVVRRGEQLTGQWSAAQERLADLSTSGRLEVAAGSGHQIPVDAPSVVVAAVREASGAPR